MTIKPFSDYAEVKEDVPIILQGVAYSDTYEGAVGDRRVINYQLDFEICYACKINATVPNFVGNSIIEQIDNL